MQRDYHKAPNKNLYESREDDNIPRALCSTRKSRHHAPKTPHNRLYFYAYQFTCMCAHTTKKKKSYEQQKTLYALVMLSGQRVFGVSLARSRFPGGGDQSSTARTCQAKSIIFIIMPATMRALFFLPGLAGWFPENVFS